LLIFILQNYPSLSLIHVQSTTCGTEFKLNGNFLPKFPLSPLTSQARPLILSGSTKRSSQKFRTIKRNGITWS